MAARVATHIPISNVPSSELWWQVSVEHLDQEARNIVGEEACERSPLHFIEAMGPLSNLVASIFHVKSSRPPFAPRKFGVKSLL